MPPKAKVTREAILDAAFELAREQGFEAITARRLAERLGCSTQPVLYQFESVRQILEETYRRADDFHTARLFDGLESAEEPLLALGLNYIRFAAEEKPLFKFLFQSGWFEGRTLEELIAQPEAAPLLALAGEATGLPEAECRRVFEALFAAVHGYASLLANNAMRWDGEAARATLTMLFEGLMKRGGDEDEEAL